MTSIKPRLNRSYLGRHGDYHLVIQILRHRQKREIPTVFRLYADELDPETGLMVYRKSHKRHPETIAEVNRRIALMISELEELASSLCALKGESFTAGDLADAYSLRKDPGQMFVYASCQVSRLYSEGRDSTAGNYLSGFRAFAAFLGHRQISFSEFTADVVDDFVRYLDRRNNMPNTKTFYLKQLRVIYNKALKEGIVGEDLHPFRNQPMRSEKTGKLALPVADLRRIAHAELCGLSGNDRLARDLFMFSFYARGMAFVDMCRLKKSNIEGAYLCYRRKKTDRPLRVFIEKPLRELLKRYSDPCSEYLLPMLRRDDSYVARRSVQRKLNKHIRLLGVRLGFSSPLRFYVARHTWATLARDRGVGLSVISESMGHTSEKTTRIYLAEMDSRQLDLANRSVLKCLK